MIRADRIKSEMFGGVGFRDTTLSDYPTVNASNKTSASGLIFQDAVSFVSIQNIYDCQLDSGLSDEEFNTYLTNLQNAVILDTCQKINSNESDFIQSTNLYPYEKSFKNTITPEGRFVGFQIDRKNKVNLLGNISWVELTFDSEATFDLHLYNSNRPNTPIKTQSVTTDANNSVIVSLDSWYIADGANFKGGTFYLGYFENALGSSKAIKRDYELSDVYANTICHYITPIVMGYSGTKIDVTTGSEKSDTFGLNFGIDIYNDYTELFIRNKAMFYLAIYYQMAEKIYHLIRTTVRSNNIERLNKELVNDMSFELYGSKEAGIVGVTGKLSMTIENLKKTLFYKPMISRRTLR